MQDGDTLVQRPWGQYMKLYQESGVWVKRVEVDPGHRLSLQQHHKRSEKWIVVRGTGRVLINDREQDLGPGAIVDVPKEAAHRIANTGKNKLVFIEVACGDYLGEDDITRLQDDYVRG
jgi:mannose-6-phosphate isomerase-like protein (cupin superfamily)